MKKNTVYNIGILIFVILSIMFVVEVINYFSVTGAVTYSVWPPNLEQVFIPNSSVFYGVNGESHFTINQLGYRGPMINNENNEYRILVLGGSTTECLYLDDSEAWPYLIMEKLKQTNDGKKVVVINVGKSGHNTRDHIIQLEHLIDNHKPDLIFMMLGANDMLLKLSKRWVWKPFDEDFYDHTKSFSLSPEYSLESSFLYRNFNALYSKYVLDLKPQDVSGGVITERRLERSSSISYIENLPDLNPALEDYEKSLNRLIEISREKNVSLVFSTQPFLWKENMTDFEDSLLWMSTDFNGNFYYTEMMVESMDAFNARLLKVCSENLDVFCIDLEKNIPKTVDYFYDDMHFNEKGAERISSDLSDYIRDNFEDFR